MKILNPIKTYRTYKKWKSIVKFNQNELKNKGFLINWIYQLGLIVSLTDADIDDLKFMSNPYQYEIAKKQFINDRIREELQKHNQLFFDQGLLEIIADDINIEESQIQNFTYYITLTSKKYHFDNTSVILFSILGGVLILSYLIYNFLK